MPPRGKSTRAESNREQNHVLYALAFFLAVSAFGVRTCTVCGDSEEDDQGRAAATAAVSLKAAARFRTLDYGWDAPRPCGTIIALSLARASEEQLRKYRLAADIRKE